MSERRVCFEVNSIASRSPFLIGPTGAHSCEPCGEKHPQVLKGSHRSLLGVPQYSVLSAGGA